MSETESSAAVDAEEPSPEAPAESPAEPHPSHAIEDPPRMSALGSALVIAALTLLAALALAPPNALRVLGGAGVVLALAAVASGERAAVHVSLLVGLMLFWHASRAPTLWPLYLLGPFAAYGIAMIAAPRLRAGVGWTRRGEIDRVTWGLIAATVAVSSLALVVWFKLVRPDVGDVLAQIPPIGTPGLAAIGLGFALVNAALEEAIWRGVFMEGLDASLGAGAASVVIQAASFGMAHIGGVPRGWLGVAMAGFYGLMLGVIRRRSRGMLAPFIAHVFADATIFAVLMTLLRRAGS